MRAERGAADCVGLVSHGREFQVFSKSDGKLVEGLEQGKHMIQYACGKDHSGSCVEETFMGWGEVA